MHATVCDYIAEIVQNSIEAGATRIALDVTTTADELRVVVRDNGKGMTAELIEQARSPFYTEPGKHDKRKVGLGLSFLYQAAQALGGDARVTSAPGVGTEVTFAFDPHNLDTPPLGDFAQTAVTLMAFPGSYDLRVRRVSGQGEYTVSRHELIEALGNLEEAGNLVLAREFFESQEQHEE